jgi:ArsR family transcriptional regulator
MSSSSPSTTCVDKLKLLADPTRLAVLEALMDRPKQVNELLDQLGVEQSLLSHHLALLREAEMVESIRKGKAVQYQLGQEVRGTTQGKSLDLGCCQLSFSPSSKSVKKR